MSVIGRVWIVMGAVVWKAARVLAYISVGTLLFSIIVIIRESFGRYFFDAPSGYSYPLLQMILLCSVYFGLAYTATVDGHVASDFVYNRLPLRGQEFVNILSNVVAAVLGYLLSTQSWAMVQQSWRIGATIPMLFDLPLAVPQAFITIGSIMLILVSATKIPYHVRFFIAGDRDVVYPPRQWLAGTRSAVSTTGDVDTAI